jgi:hypothetical protein
MNNHQLNVLLVELLQFVEHYKLNYESFTSMQSLRVPDTTAGREFVLTSISIAEFWTPPDWLAGLKSWLCMPRVCRFGENYDKSEEILVDDYPELSVGYSRPTE